MGSGVVGELGSLDGASVIGDKVGLSETGASDGGGVLTLHASTNAQQLKKSDTN